MLMSLPDRLPPAVMDQFLCGLLSHRYEASSVVNKMEKQVQWGPKVSKHKWKHFITLFIFNYKLYLHNLNYVIKSTEFKCDY